MPLGPILAYTLLPLAVMIGGLAMMFSGAAPPVWAPAMMAGGGVLLTASMGSLALFTALHVMRMQSVRLRRD